ncbi:MAG TPA: hypothetical protein VG675_25580 [Bryobacteraceae bacterium]|nr:hypothetical protein [Bryobacteraceae bacterium]
MPNYYDPSVGVLRQMYRDLRECYSIIQRRKLNKWDVALMFFSDVIAPVLQKYVLPLVIAFVVAWLVGPASRTGR